MSKFALFNAFANGLPVTLYHVGRSGDVRVVARASRIYGVRVESGYGVGQAPSQFMVTYYDDTTGNVCDNYIKTID